MARAAKLSGNNPPVSKPAGIGHNLQGAEEAIKRSIADLVAREDAMFAAKAEFDKVKGSFRAGLKALLVLGKPFDWNAKDVSFMLEARRRDPSEFDNEVKRRNRLMKFAGMVVGTQLGMAFDAPGKSIATVTEDAAAVAAATPAAATTAAPANDDAIPEEHAAEAEAYVDGRKEGVAGISISANPFQEETAAHVAWEAGWKFGQDARATKLADAKVVDLNRGGAVALPKPPADPKPKKAAGKPAGGGAPKATRRGAFKD